MAESTVSSSEDNIRLESGDADKLSRVAYGVGAAAILGAWFLAPDVVDFFKSYLLAFMYVLSIGLGLLWFVCIQHLTGARWSVVVRRVAEILSLGLLVLAVLSLGLVIPMIMKMHPLQEIYVWLDQAEIAKSHLLEHKTAYLNTTFFGIRWVVYLLVWCGMAWFFFKKSVAQDADGKSELTASMVKLSAPGMILFALTLTFASFDLLMSLEPEWFSTIFGVYYFAGCVLAGYSTLALVLMWLQQRGMLAKSVNVEHYHDLGKMMFGFIIFWAYIGFSQFMLIWYGDVPEETRWFHFRFRGDWKAVSAFLLVGHFVVPFLWLLSRWVKRDKTKLAAGALWILFAHYVDLFWMVYPKGGDVVAPRLTDALCLLFMLSFFAGFALNRAKGINLIPTKDPKLAESLAFENI